MNAVLPPEPRRWLRIVSRVRVDPAARPVGAVIPPENGFHGQGLDAERRQVGVQV